MWFDNATSSILGDARLIADNRGQEYQDSWALGNRIHPFYDLVVGNFPAQEDPEPYVRALQLASLCDTKLSRLSGNYKEDNLVDLINYIAALAYSFREEQK